MAGTSFLSPADVAAVEQAERDAFATVLALDPYSLTLYRFNKSAGQDQARPAQIVVMTYTTTRMAQDASSEGAEVQNAQGTFEKDLPFDVMLGDRFTLAGGQDGRITRVPTSDGITQIAEFVVDEGRA